jgi:RimJ/RimL family protein N-acetyltransferase
VAIIYETERLVVRDWEPEVDAAQTLIMHADPEVMRFIGKGQVATGIEEERERLREIVGRFARFCGRLGFWAIEVRDSGGLVAGAVMLKPLPDAERHFTDDIEVGWRLRRDCWGRGYATEAARGALAHGFGQLGLTTIHAVVDPANDASKRVALRLGMMPMGRTSRYYGEALDLFSLQATDRESHVG